MRKTSLFLFFFLAFSYAYSQSVTLYQDCNYRGGSRTLSPGRYSLDRIGFGGGTLSSFRVPRGLKLVLYDGNEPGTGSKMRYESDMACLSRDWNDRARSILIEYDNSGGGNSNAGNNYPVYPSYGGSNGAQVILYEDCSLMGNNGSLSPGSYDTRDMRIRNDAISSIRIPRGYSVTVFRDGGFRGESQTYYSNVYCLDGRWTDQISSVIVRGPGDNSGGSNNYPSGGSSSGDRVQVFEDCDYRGNRGEFRPGSYKTGYLIVKNDRISSMRIPRGFRVIAFENDDFKGNRRTFTGDQYCLDGAWNDKISSMVVEGPGGGSNNYNDDYNSSNNNYNNYNNYNGITVYMDSWYRGDHVVFNNGYHDLRNGNLQANISSMSIQPGYRVTVYDDFNFRGRSQTFTGSVPNLSGLGWNDRIRSIIVSRN
jgi:hypothetical protein